MDKVTKDVYVYRGTFIRYEDGQWVAYFMNMPFLRNTQLMLVKQKIDGMKTAKVSPV